jgi:hypothetical protein
MLPPEGSAAAYDFYIVELLFTAIFAAELLVCIFCSWFWDFITDAWNIFDSIVVIISVTGRVN